MLSSSQPSTRFVLFVTCVFDDLIHNSHHDDLIHNCVMFVHFALDQRLFDQQQQISTAHAQELQQLRVDLYDKNEASTIQVFQRIFRLSGFFVVFPCFDRSHFSLFYVAFSLFHVAPLTLPSCALSHLHKFFQRLQEQERGLNQFHVERLQARVRELQGEHQMNMTQVCESCFVSLTLSSAPPCLHVCKCGCCLNGFSACDVVWIDSAASQGV